jgi:hypothetical protein
MTAPMIIAARVHGRAAAEAFWNLPAHAEVKRLPEGLAGVQVMLVGT